MIGDEKPHAQCVLPPQNCLTSCVHVENLCVLFELLYVVKYVCVLCMYMCVCSYLYCYQKAKMTCVLALNQMFVLSEFNPPP